MHISHQIICKALRISLTGVLLLFAQNCLSGDLLSKEQRQWLSKHPVIKIAPDPDFPPIEYFDSHGQYQGIAADYVELLAQKLAIDFTIVNLKDWNTVLEQAQSQEIDMFGAAAPTPQRLEYMNFTPPHFELPGVILVADRVAGSNLNMDDLRGLRVAVVDGYVWEDLISNDYPDVELVPMPDIPSGLNALSFGSVDAMVANLAIATHYIKKSGITNLKVAGETGYHGRYAFGVRKDWPELIPILEAGMAAITPEEHKAILDRWVSVKHTSSLLSSKQFWISLSVVALLLGIAAILIWNRQLKKQVEQRTQELRDSFEQQLQTKEALRHSEDRYTALTNNAYDAIFLLDTSTLSVIESNISASKLFGCSAKELQEIPPYQRSPKIQPDGQTSEEKGPKFLERAIQGIPQVFEWRHTRADGSFFDSEVSLSRVVSNNKIHILAIIRDISERKRIDRMKDEFISTVSHEIRTPLTSIRGSLGLLHGGMVGTLPEKAAELVSIAHSNTERLLNIVNDLLDMQKLESGSVELHMEPIQLLPFLQQAIESNNAYAESHNVALKLIPPEEDITVKIDEHRLMQVMNNLLSNASKFSPEGEEVICRIEEEADHVCIQVIDQGPGVPEEFIPHLFKRFSQADGYSTRKTGGTGLGLSISKNIVEKHNGKLEYKRDDKGSCFWFRLPKVR